MTDAPPDLLAIRPMTHRDDGDPVAPAWLQRVMRDPEMFPSARRVATWLAQNGGGEAFRPDLIGADLQLHVKSVRAALEALERGGYIALRPSIRIRAIKLLLRK